MKKNLKNWAFLLCFVLFFTLFDAGIAYFGEEIWPYDANDYEATRAAHPEEVWDRVLFGNSDVIAAYRENLSEAGYVNFGMDYGVVTDLWEVLRQGHVRIGSELVIGLDVFALYDHFDTNPTYIWHRGPLEPYVYFHRDKLHRIAKDIKRILDGNRVRGFGKALYYGSMTDEELAQKIEKFETRYYCLPIEDFQENVAALDKIADWCDSHDVRLRILWMPFNPDVQKPELMLKLMAQVNEWCDRRGIIAADFTDAFEREYFYDVNHLNDEIGAGKFTEVIDQWLLG